MLSILMDIFLRYVCSMFGVSREGQKSRSKIKKFNLDKFLSEKWILDFFILFLHHEKYEKSSKSSRNKANKDYIHCSNRRTSWSVSYTIFIDDEMILPIFLEDKYRISLIIHHSQKCRSETFLIIEDDPRNLIPIQSDRDTRNSSSVIEEKPWSPFTTGGKLCCHLSVWSSEDKILSSDRLCKACKRHANQQQTI